MGRKVPSGPLNLGGNPQGTAKAPKRVSGMQNSTILKGSTVTQATVAPTGRYRPNSKGKIQ